MTAETKKPTLDELVEAFKDAFKVSDVLTVDFGDDGGTCNMDTATIIPEKGERLATYEKAANACGLRIYKIDWLGGRAFWVFPPRVAGQGNARTRQAEAIKDALKKHGLNAMVYYQMD